ncbi:MAG: antibiotic biosynthesis monooxygenase [Sedimentisphaerales bacterium]|nr:antibiotic biosynthesis monooxygenase [Sedimentisphaerales bacterium]
MSEQTVTVIARFKAKEGKVEELESVLMDLIAPTREEPGCVSYVLHHAQDDPRSFLFVENWASQMALDEHLEKPYLKALVARADELLAEPLDVSLWHQILR